MWTDRWTGKIRDRGRCFTVIMQPLGRKPKHHNYKDYHPIKGYMNWWEVELDPGENKKGERRETKICLKNILNQLTIANKCE